MSKHSPALRLQKYLSQCGICSRRQAEPLIVAGRITVNGAVVDQLGSKVNPMHDRVKLDGTLVEPHAPTVIALHKPFGFVTSKQATASEPQIIMDLLPAKWQHLFPVGRLDKATSGLILLTNDGQLAQRLMHPKYDHHKTYEVLLTAPLTDTQLRQLSCQNQYILGKSVKSFTVRKLAAQRVEITLREGRHHQVRRLLRNCGNGVRKLRRVAIGRVTLAQLGLAAGEWRKLTAAEIAAVQQ